MGKIFLLHMGKKLGMYGAGVGQRAGCLCSGTSLSANKDKVASANV